MRTVVSVLSLSVLSILVASTGCEQSPTSERPSVTGQTEALSQRVHPPTRLDMQSVKGLKVELLIPKTVYKVGELVEMDVTLTNPTRREIEAPQMTFSSAGIEFEYAYPGGQATLTGLGGEEVQAVYTLGPGQSVKTIFRRDFTDPGFYVLVARYAGVVTSNMVRFQVTP
jgi:hypothetical protein